MSPFHKVIVQRVQAHYHIKCIGRAQVMHSINHHIPLQARLHLVTHQVQCPLSFQQMHQSITFRHKVGYRISLYLLSIHCIDLAMYYYY